MPHICSENASELALRRWQICPTHAKPEPEPEPHDPNKSPTEDELACVREQLKALNKQMEDCSDSEEWDRLTRSKERLFRIWARLAQLPSDPKPVQLKASATRTRATPEPTLATPTAEQPKPEQGQG